MPEAASALFVSQWDPDHDVIRNAIYRVSLFALTNLNLLISVVFSSTLKETFYCKNSEIHYKTLNKFYSIFTEFLLNF